MIRWKEFGKVSNPTSNTVIIASPNRYWQLTTKATGGGEDWPFVHVVFKCVESTWPQDRVYDGVVYIDVDTITLSCLSWPEVYTGLKLGSRVVTGIFYDCDGRRQTPKRGSGLSSLIGCPDTVETIKLTKSDVRDLTGAPTKLKEVYIGESPFCSFAGSAREIHHLHIQSTSNCDYAGISAHLNRVGMLTVQQFDMYQYIPTGLASIIAVAEHVGFANGYDSQSLRFGDRIYPDVFAMELNVPSELADPTNSSSLLTWTVIDLLDSIRNEFGGYTRTARLKFQREMLSLGLNYML